MTCKGCLAPDCECRKAMADYTDQLLQDCLICGKPWHVNCGHEIPEPVVSGDSGE